MHHDRMHALGKKRQSRSCDVTHAGPTLRPTTISRRPTTANIAAKLATLAFRFCDNMRCKILLGVSVNVASYLNPRVAFATSRKTEEHRFRLVA